MPSILNDTRNEAAFSPRAQPEFTTNVFEVWGAALCGPFPREIKAILVQKKFFGAECYE